MVIKFNSLFWSCWRLADDLSEVCSTVTFDLPDTRKTHRCVSPHGKLWPWLYPPEPCWLDWHAPCDLKTGVYKQLKAGSGLNEGQSKLSAGTVPCAPGALQAALHSHWPLEASWWVEPRQTRWVWRQTKERWFILNKIKWEIKCPWGTPFNQGNVCNERFFTCSSWSTFIR